MTDAEEIEYLEKLRRLKELQDAEQAQSPKGMMDTLVSGAKRGGASLMSGFGKTVGGLGFMLGGKDTPLEKGGKRVQEYWKEFGDKYGMESGLPQKAVEGVGGGLVLPMGVAAQPVRSLLGNTLGGAGGEVGAELGKGFGLKLDFRGQPIDVGQILGGLVGGMGAGYAAGPRQSIAQQDIRGDLAGLTPDQWAETQRNAQAFERAGSTTATAAEAFPGINSNIVRRARQASSDSAANDLSERLAFRDADLGQMSQRVPRAIGPEVSVPQVAGDAARAAAARQGQLQRAASRPLDMIARDEAAGRLPRIPESEMGAIYQDYTRLANTRGLSRSDVTARQNMLPEFLDVNAPPRQVLRVAPNQTMSFQNEPGFQENLSALLLNIAENSKRPTGPMATAAQTIPQRATNEARSLAFDATRSLPAPWGPRALNAGEEYLRRKQAWVTPATEGTLGAISGNKNRITGVVTEGKLDAVLNDVLPGATRQTLRDLQKGGGNTRDIATALVQKQLEGSPTNFPSVLAGNPGSPKARQFDELVQAAGGDAGQVSDLMTTGRQLQQLSPAAGMSGFPEIRGLQYLIRPFRSLDMALTLRNESAVQREVANLLADPANLPRLREIAQFDPMVRRAMMAKSAAIPLMQNQEEQ